MKEIIVTHAETGKVISKKEGTKGNEYPVIRVFIKDVFGNDREFRFFVNRTDMQFLGIDYSDFEIKR